MEGTGRRDPALPILPEAPGCPPDGDPIIPFMIERNGAYLGHLAGVPIYIHWTALLMVWMTWTWAGGHGPVFFIVALLALVLGILLHELGHGLAAKSLGGTGITITLWALGGVCSSNRSSSRPGHELIVIAAGPAVSFLLAGLGWLGLQFLPHVQGLPPAAHGILVDFSFCMMFINLVLGIFNMLPIFPLDGGQIVYQGQRLIGVPAGIRNQISLALAVIGAFAYVAWVSRDGVIDGYTLFSMAFMAFLVWQAWLHLR
jgi:hypothetical protein